MDDIFKRINKRGGVIWFTGLSGAGKTTIADGVHKYLCGRNVLCDRFDGDSIRGNLNEHLDFSEEGRRRNVEIAGFVSGRIALHGIIVLSSFISPFRSQRSRLRNKIKNFVEVYVNAPLEVC